MVELDEILKMSRRPSLPSKTETEVLLLSGRRCSVCFGLRGDADVKKGQIAHLDRNPSNNSSENVVFLCLEHHDEYDSQTRQSKGLTKRELQQYRNLLYQARNSLAQRFTTSQKDTQLEDHIIRELSARTFAARDRQFSFADVFSATSAQLATGCSLAYFGLLLVDFLGLGDKAIGWDALRRALGFEASEIFGELVLFGLCEQAPGSHPRRETYRLTDLGRSVALAMRPGGTIGNRGA